MSISDFSLLCWVINLKIDSISQRGSIACQIPFKGYLAFQDELGFIKR